MAGVTASLAVREYRLKTAAEIRLTESMRAESDVKLLTLFVQLMPLANARSGAALSESAAAALMKSLTEREDFTALDDEELSKRTARLLASSTVNLPVGAATQAAALSAIAKLGDRYPDSLQAPAAEAIDALRYIAEQGKGPVDAWRRAQALVGRPRGSVAPSPDRRAGAVDRPSREPGP